MTSASGFNLKHQLVFGVGGDWILDFFFSFVGIPRSLIQLSKVLSVKLTGILKPYNCIDQYIKYSIIILKKIIKLNYLLNWKKKNNN